MPRSNSREGAPGRLCPVTFTPQLAFAICKHSDVEERPGRGAFQRAGCGLWGVISRAYQKDPCSSLDGAKCPRLLDSPSGMSRDPLKVGWAEGQSQGGGRPPASPRLCQPPAPHPQRLGWPVFGVCCTLETLVNAPSQVYTYSGFCVLLRGKQRKIGQVLHLRSRNITSSISFAADQPKNCRKAVIKC